MRLTVANFSPTFDQDLVDWGLPDQRVLKSNASQAATWRAKKKRKISPTCEKLKELEAFISGGLLLYLHCPNGPRGPSLLQYSGPLCSAHLAHAPRMHPRLLTCHVSARLDLRAELARWCAATWQHRHVSSTRVPHRIFPFFFFFYKYLKNSK